MCGRYALCDPISRHRRDRPDIPEWYFALADAINARPMRFNIIKGAQEPRLTYYPVPKAVGSPKNDSPDLVVAVGQ